MCVQKKTTAAMTETVLANIREAMKANLETQADLESKGTADSEEGVGSDEVMKFKVFRFGNSSQPVSMTLQSVPAGSDVSIDTGKGSVELPGAMFTTFTSLQVFLSIFTYSIVLYCYLFHLFYKMSLLILLYSILLYIFLTIVTFISVNIFKSKSIFSTCLASS